ncbi:hypothetical protein DXG01_003821 [Tephrocybe rancida]|nr:hypothetical protein DXG01_003821 [Tephrocybe rancida]
MKAPTAAFCLLLSAALASASSPKGSSSKDPKIKNLVTFGDSYTDVGWTGDQGIAWPTYVVDYARVSLYPFAKAGATCSNNLTYRPFPSLFESQLPLYLSEKHNGSLKLDAKETIYSLWIGTNDLGVNSLVSGSNSANIVEVATCMVNWVKVLYESGARNFLFQNMVPLELTPIYSAESYPNRYWSAERNTTQWSNVMAELALSGNALTELMLTALAPSLKDAHIALFDSHALFTDMYYNPKVYLNGTVPANVTGAISSCVFDLNADLSGTGDCTMVTDKKAQDSYLWYDELHPSEQADRIVAREVSAVIGGKTSKFAKWLS